VIHRGRYKAPRFSQCGQSLDQAFGLNKEGSCVVVRSSVVHEHGSIDMIRFRKGRHLEVDILFNLSPAEKSSYTKKGPLRLQMAKG